MQQWSESYFFIDKKSPPEAGMMKSPDLDIGRDDAHKRCGPHVSVEADSFFLRKLYTARHKRKQSVIFTAANVLSGMDFRPALAYQYCTGVDQFSITDFCSEILWLGIAP